MSYDPDLADRIRALLAAETGVTEKPMFGGLAFLVDAKMAVAANSHGRLMVRVDPADTDDLVRAKNVQRMVMRGKPMNGWLDVGAQAIRDDDALRPWIERGTAYARSLTG